MRPDPIVIHGNIETIRLPGGFEVQRIGDNLPSVRYGGPADTVHGFIFDMARATHAQLTAQADEIDRLKGELKRYFDALELTKQERDAAKRGYREMRDRLRAENAELRKIAEARRAELVKGIEFAPLAYNDKDPQLAETIGVMRAEIARIDAAMAAKERA